LSQELFGDGVLHPVRPGKETPVTQDVVAVLLVSGEELRLEVPTLVVDQPRSLAVLGLD
jgi:hypothetical protein